MTTLHVSQGPHQLVVVGNADGLTLDDFGDKPIAVLVTTQEGARELGALLYEHVTVERGGSPDPLRDWNRENQASEARNGLCQEPGCEKRATFTRRRYCSAHRRCLKCGEPCSGALVPGPDREKACKPWGTCNSLQEDIDRGFCPIGVEEPRVLSLAVLHRIAEWGDASESEVRCMARDLLRQRSDPKNADKNELLAKLPKTSLPEGQNIVFDPR